VSVDVTANTSTLPCPEKSRAMTIFEMERALALAAAGCVLLLIGSFSETNRYDPAWSTTKKAMTLFFRLFCSRNAFQPECRQSAFVRRSRSYRHLLRSFEPENNSFYLSGGPTENLHSQRFMVTCQKYNGNRICLIRYHILIHVGLT
jgi:hypothetical protein